MYSVSQADYSRLYPIRYLLDQQGKTIDVRGKALDAKADAHNARHIDDTDQSAVDNYNLEKASIEGERAQFNVDVQLFNSKVDDFNAELHRVGTPNP